MTCETIWENKGVLKRLSGHVSADEFVHSVEAIQADPRFDDIRYVINDFSQAARVKVVVAHVMQPTAVYRDSH